MKKLNNTQPHRSFKKDEWRNEWHLCTSSMMQALSAITETPGKLTEMPVSSLNINLQNMPGIETVHLSGYIIPQEEIPVALVPLGEFVLLRISDDTRKAYNYAFAVSGADIYFNGPYHYCPA